MSLVPTFVQSQQGKWYKNPVVRDDDWFICWDDYEPIELVIKKSGPTLEVVLSVLKLRGWEMKPKSGKWRSGSRIFDKTFYPARAYFLEQITAPTDGILTGNPEFSMPKENMRPEGVYYFNGPNGHPR